MITLRPGAERGSFNYGWLDTRHTFSFGRYHDPAHEGFRALRVINEDRVAPAKGFPPHAHQDMEIITYVLAGALEHKDSLGSGQVLHPNEVQRMTAGRGIMHSEFNPSATEPVHLYQIWILPERDGLEPSYEQKPFPLESRQGRLALLGSPNAADGSVTIHQDVRLYAAALRAGQHVAHTLGPGRHAWVQAMRGQGQLNTQPLHAGDGTAVSDERQLTLGTDAGAEFLLFDLA